ncbi:MlaD family protein [Kamptonema cortianum]|nr:MlaD family protein [Kamptonema cortianum]
MQGLTVGAPVKFRGVVVGRVSYIGFTTSQYEEKTPPFERKNYVLVVMEVDAESLNEFAQDDLDQSDLDREIARGLRVRQQSSGLTGVSFMEFDYMNPETNRMIPITWKPIRLYIPSAPSDMSRLFKAAEEVFKKLERIDVESVVGEATNLLGELRQSNESLGLAIQNLDSVLSSGQANLEESLDNVRAITGNIRDMSETLKRDPASVIFSAPPAPAQSVAPPPKKTKPGK